MSSPAVTRPGTPDLTTAMRDLVRYRQEHLTGDEKGEGQIFLEHLFQAFGHAGLRQAGAVLEARMRRRADKRRRTSFADCIWKPRVLIEMKKTGEPLGRHYEQALEYWFRAVPDRPRYVVLCNFDEFWIYDFHHQIEEPLDRLRLEDLPRRWEALAFLLPDEVRSTFGNDLVAVTRESAARAVTTTAATPPWPASSAWRWPTSSRLVGRRPASPSRPPSATARCWLNLERRWCCGAGPSRPARLGRAGPVTPWPARVPVVAAFGWPVPCWSWLPSCAAPVLNPSSPRTTGPVDAYQAVAQRPDDSVGPVVP
jgi:hypothetical protein